jgi:hypothetical protein
LKTTSASIGRTKSGAGVRRRSKDLEEAQQALFSARISNLRQETSAEQMAVHRARRALDEADTKLRLVKRWAREFDGRVQPLVKQMEKLHTVLANDMTKAVVFLAQAIGTLAAYADKTPPPSLTSTPTNAGATPAGSEAPAAADPAAKTE